MDHSDHKLLIEANNTDDPNMKVALIAVFHYLNLSKNYSRTNKPFNALLGETYEYELDDVRMVSE